MKHLYRQDGYTLIEVLAASAIFLLAVLTVSGFLMQGYRYMASSSSRSSAIHSTQEDVEAAINGHETSEEVEVSKQSAYVMNFEVFGAAVSGTLVTVKNNGREEVTYITFVPGDGGE